MENKLVSIKIFNFKSFKGEYFIGPFNPHFNAILGPNGSGKSNIIDSILFVLGYRAKKMRHSNLKDLIYSNCDECYVCLNFNNFSVKRHINLSKSSKYFIKINQNNNFDQSLLKNNLIIDLLKNNDFVNINANDLYDFYKLINIDIDHNRFLILQGEIENISMLSNFELLSYIEDTIGTSYLKENIDILSNDKDKLNNQLTLKNDQYQFIEKEFQFKKNMKNDKMLLLKNNKKLLIIKNKIFLINNLINKKNKNFLLDDINNNKSLLLNLKENQNNLIKNQKSEKLNLLNKTLKDKENLFLNEKNKIKKIEIKNKLKNDINIKINKNIENTKELNLINKEMDEKIINLKENEQKLNEIINKNLFYKKSKENKKNYENIFENLLLIKENIDKLKYNENLLVENNSVELKEFEYEFNNKINEINLLKIDIKKTYNEILNRKNNIKEFKYIENNYKREIEVFENIKHIKGVLGPLKNLGKIKKGYEQAIEASTSSFNSMVVENTKIAEDCIKIINQKKLQRTTFLILDKIEDKKIEEDFREKYLFNFIETEQKYLKLFKFALKDTLIADEIEEGKKLAFTGKRKRVVTKDGKLIEKSGIMTGGQKIKLKSVEELEKVYENMNLILKQKNLENENLKNKIYEIKNKNENKKNAEIQIFKLKKIIEENKNNLLNLLNSKNINLNVNEEISVLIDKIKEKIKINENFEGSEDIKKLNFCINALKNEIIEKQNKKRIIEINFTEIKDKQIKDLEEIDYTLLNTLEAEYNEELIKYKKLTKEITEIKKQIEKSYEEEIQFSNKIESNEIEIEEIEKTMVKEENEIKKIEETLKKINIFLKEEKEEIIIEKEDLEEEVKRLKRKLKENEVSIEKEDLENVKIIFSEYEELKENYKKEKEKINEIKKKLLDINIEIEENKRKRLEEFNKGFIKINKYLKEIFNSVTFGGNAELDFVDYLDPFTEGLGLNIMPPKKAWKNISNLSGGEKTLSSLSLIFALHKYKPTSFYILDEIDAALDYKNVSIISQYLQNIRAQFILISFRNDMFEIAKTLIGVYKIKEESKIIMTNIDEINDK